MRCEDCQSKEATVHYQEIVDGNYSEIHLCDECAKKKGLDTIHIFPPLGLANLLAGLVELDKEFPKERGVTTRCERCGLTYTEFKERGRVGCSHCYEAFESQMRHILRKIHGNIQHTGKLIPRAQVSEKREIAALRKELERAISREEFERAAEIRDKIKLLEKKEDGA